MKKITFLLFVSLILTMCANAQMSFTGNSLKKSAFDLNTDDKTVFNDKTADSKVFISDEDNDTDKKRRKKRGRGRRGGFENSIKGNPLVFLFGYFGATYERKIGDQMSLSLGAAYYSNSSGGFGSSFKYSGFNLSPEFRYYFSEAIEGFYMGGTFNFTSISSTYEGTTIDLVTLEEVPDIKKGTTTIIGAGVSTGHQWIWGGFTLDVYGGAGFLSASSSGDITGGLAFGGFWPVLGVAIGYSF
jgi:hypothetical protein